MRVAVPTVWPPIFVGPGQKGKLDWLGEEIGFAQGDVCDIIEKAVVEEGPIPLIEYVTVFRKDKPPVYLGPSLTMPGKLFRKVEIRKTPQRIFLDVRRGGEEGEEAEGKDEEGEDEQFDSMMDRRREDMEEEEQQEEREHEEEEEENEEEYAKKVMDGKKEETDPEERRRPIHQGRRGGE